MRYFKVLAVNKGKGREGEKGRKKEKGSLQEYTDISIAAAL